MRRRVRGLVLALALLPTILVTTVAARPTTTLSPLPITTGNRLLDQAERVALEVLMANQKGATHRAAPFYLTPWLRDSYAWGMVPDDRGTLHTYAHGELSYFLKQQQPFGGWVTFQYSGWYDETPIMIAAVLDAYRLSGNRAMVRHALPLLRRGWNWLYGSYTAPSHGSHCLLWVTLRPSGQHWAADWADQVARQGYTPQLEGLWYSATHAMAALSWLQGDKAAAHGYDRAAACIARDTDRLLWSVNAPAHRDADPLAPFGHYRAWPAGRNYFEVDGNALLIAAGVATRAQRAHVLDAVAAHESYLLGVAPARVVYGDYAPQDYGPIHNWMAPGRYQSAYWPSVGGLLAMAAARNDDTALSSQVLQGLAGRNSDAGSAFHEWFTADGTPNGAATYGWGARMYLLALYRAYLGVDDAPGTSNPADLVLRAAPGPARGALVRLGMHITIVGHGSGSFHYARLDGRTLHSFLVPARLLHDGAVLDVYRGPAYHR